MSSGDVNGDGSGDGTLVNENLFTILFTISWVSAMVELMSLLLRIYRLYSGDSVSAWETEWESSGIGISIITSFKVNEGLLLIGLFLIFWSSFCEYYSYQRIGVGF